MVILISKKGKLQIPYVWQHGLLKGYNSYGQPYAKVGDAVIVGSPSGVFSMKTVGIVTDTKSMAHINFGNALTVSTLLNTTREEKESDLCVITKEQLEDIKNFYHI